MHGLRCRLSGCLLEPDDLTRRPGVADVLEEMFRASSLEEQRHLYESRLRDRVWTPWVDRFNAGEFTQMLMGIPWRQRQFILRYPGRLAR